MESQWRAHRQESHLDEGVASLRKETEPEATDELKEVEPSRKAARLALEFINQRSTNELFCSKGSTENHTQLELLTCGGRPLRMQTTLPRPSRR